ncbi:hypothetical protein F5B21DRAFT_492847 [Xylaria acuta]|nr:hypothetical protein F5B21DRAFT_492847 [Xylaria acuta]
MPSSSSKRARNDLGQGRDPVEQANITTRAAKAMENATGHQSLELFKLGYMLYIVEKHTEYTLNDLADVMETDWCFPGDDFNDPELPNHVRDLVFFPCNMAEETSRNEVHELLRNPHNLNQTPAVMRMFLNGPGPNETDETWSLPRKITLFPATIEAVLCAEIWCAWESRKQSPLPSRKAFMNLFAPKTATIVKKIARRLQKLSTMGEVWGHFLQFYGGTEIIGNTDALNALAEAI